MGVEGNKIDSINAENNKKMLKTQTPMIAYRQNKDLVLNSIAYLADREEDITVRKSTGAVTYTATEQENKIILAIITFVPLLIIVIGIIVWANRRRKK